MKKSKRKTGKRKKGKSKQRKSKDREPTVPHDLEFYQRIVERNKQAMLENDDVVAFGIGYRRRRGEWTSELSLIIEVKKKRSNVAAQRRIPAMIEGIPTDVVESRKREFADPESSAEIAAADESSQARPVPRAMSSRRPRSGGSRRARSSERTPLRERSVPEAVVSGRNEDWRKRGMPRISNVEFNPLMGGIPIRNPDIPKMNACVLGAIVFDAKTGDAHGLSVHHGVGDNAEPEAPINQPMKNEKQYKIGTLVKTDSDFDAALFRIETARGVEAKVVGEPVNFEPGEPIEPKQGMKVECFGRRNHAKGEVMYVSSWYSKSNRSWLREVHIRVDKGFVTQGGDSGSLWVESESNRPIGLHLGSAVGDETHDIASCMVDLAKAWRFRFSKPPKSRILEAELSDFQTCFINKGKGFIAICQRPGENVRVKKFDENFKKTSEQVNAVTPKSGFAAAELKQDAKGKPNPILTFWRTWDDRIKCGKLDPSGTKLVGLQNKPFSFKTYHRPAAVSFGKKVVFAFTDATTSKITIVTTSTGNRWSYIQTNYQSISAPELTVFDGALIAAWVAPDNSRSMVSNSLGQLKIGKLAAQSTSFKISSSRNVTQSNSTRFNPALCVGGDQIFLAFTNAANQIEILKGSSIYSLKPHDKLMSVSAASPSLFYFQDELICSRREGVYPQSKVWWY